LVGGVAEGFCAAEELSDAAGVSVVLHNLIHPLDRQQLPAIAGMSRLATSLVAFRRLKPQAVDGGRFEGIAEAAADSLTQDAQLGRQGAELGAELLTLLLLYLALIH
jgi:hypothetical protein